MPDERRAELHTRIRSATGATWEQVAALMEAVRRDDEAVVENALDGDEESAEDLVSMAARNFESFQLIPEATPESVVRAAKKRSPAPAEERVEDFTHYASEAEQLRAGALASHYAKLAKALPYVLRFREAVLGGGIVPPYPAWIILQSPLAAHLPPMLIRDRGLDITDPDWVQRPLPDGLQVELRNLRDKRQDILIFEKRRVTGSCSWRDWEGRSRSTAYHEGSALEQLDHWARQLAAEFPWSAHDAAWFLLTGDVPDVSAIRVSLHEVRDRPGNDAEYNRVEVTIRAEAWVSATTVRRAYTVVQSELLKAAGRRKLKGIDAAMLELVRFADRWIQEHGRPNYRAMGRAWNAFAAEEHRYADHKNFGYAYKRTLRSLLMAPFRIPRYAWSEEETGRDQPPGGASSSRAGVSGDLN